MFTSLVMNTAFFSILFVYHLCNQNSIVAGLTFVRVIIQDFFIHYEMEFFKIYGKSPKTNGDKKKKRK